MTRRSIACRARPASFTGRCFPKQEGRAFKRAALVAAALGAALLLPGCAAGSLQGLAENAQITTGSSDVQTALRAEARRLVQPLPAARAAASGGFSLGNMLDVLVNGMSEEELAAEREAAKAPQGAEAAAARYIAARGGRAAPDLAAIEADLADKARNAARFAAAARAVLTWHGQLRASFYSGQVAQADGAGISALIERDKAVISSTYTTVSEQAAVLKEAVRRLRGRMGAEQVQRVAQLVTSLDTEVSRIGALAGEGLGGPVG